jgi:hypothetical protein
MIVEIPQLIGWRVFFHEKKILLGRAVCAPRVAANSDAPLLTDWFAAFVDEVHDTDAGEDQAAGVRDKLSHGGILVREAPTSNSIYQRIGYRPVEDRVVLAFFTH